VPAPIGNQNARKGKLWNAAILRALEKRSRADRIEALDALAEKLLQGCDEGDITALKELGDRLDGKATQAIEGVMETVHSFAVPLPADTRTAAEWAQTIGK